MQTIEGEIRKYIIENFLFGQDDQTLSNSDSFLEKGIIDSTGVLELVSFLEEKFQMKIDDDELVPSNLDSISQIAKFVMLKQKAGK